MLKAPIIHGVLRCSEIGNIVALPKSGKSLFALGLGVAVATGRPWLGNETTKGRVLVIDNEHEMGTVADRLRRVSEALGTEEPSDFLALKSLRYRSVGINGLDACFDGIGSGDFSLVIIDALWRALPSGCQPDNNTDMARFYQQLEGIADRLGCAIVCVRCASEGRRQDESGLEALANGRGQNGGADTEIVLWPHTEADAAVLQIEAETWPRMKPLALRWKFPLWLPAPELDATDMKRVS